MRVVEMLIECQYNENKYKKGECKIVSLMHEQCARIEVKINKVIRSLFTKTLLRACNNNVSTY